jgi:hypothetical protein
MGLSLPGVDLWFERAGNAGNFIFDLFSWPSIIVAALVLF